MKSFTWDQVNAWRLGQHCLASRLERRDFIKAVTRTGGIQAQVMSAAELALGMRVEGLTPEDIQAALWQERSLVKTWAMRGTLHLIAAEELPLYVAARSLHEARNWLKHFTYYGITPAQYEAFIAAVPQVLGEEPMTREQLALALVDQTGIVELREAILSSGWGTPLKPAAFRGELCFGPNQGQNVTFVSPRHWLGPQPTIEPELALQEIARRYLQAYGPTTLEEFARWWWGGAGLTPAKKLFRSIADELEEVEVEGWRALALRTTLEPMRSLEPAGMIHLLPLFDAYTFGLRRNIEPFLPEVYQSQVYRPQGWISAVVLANGYVKGIWEHKTQGSETIVKVRLFSSPPAAIKQGIEAEAERLGAFLNTQVVLAYETER